MVAGDLNAITKESKKDGGRVFNFSQSRDFVNALNDCALKDLGYTGNRFTWMNKQPGVAFIRK